MCRLCDRYAVFLTKCVAAGPLLSGFHRSLLAFRRTMRLHVLTSCLPPSMGEGGSPTGLTDEGAAFAHLSSFRSPSSAPHGAPSPLFGGKARWSPFRGFCLTLARGRTFVAFVLHSRGLPFRGFLPSPIYGGRCQPDMADG